MKCRFERVWNDTGTALLMLLVFFRFDAELMAQTLSQQLKAESVERLAKDARQQGNAVRGAILFTQQNLSCTKCHTDGAARPIGPNLKNLSSELTDVYLVEALLQPSKTIRKGFESASVVTIAGRTFNGRIIEDSPDRIVLQVANDRLQQVTLPRSDIDVIAPSRMSAMPENLVDQLAGREQFLDLVRYMMELAAAEKTQTPGGHLAGGKTISLEHQGIVLLKEYSCSSCHTDDVTGSQLVDKQAPDLLRSIGRIDPRFVERFIASPLTVKPGTTMPHMMSGMGDSEIQTAATEMTNYLLSLSTASFQTRTVDPEAAERGQELFHSVGCVACHSPRDESGREMLSDSSVLLAGVGDRYSIDGLVAFLKNPLEVRPSGRMPAMRLTHWEATDLASYLLSGPRQEPAADSFVPNPSLVEKGKARFGELGCRQCHHLESTGAKPVSLPLSEVRIGEGCLSGKRGNWPLFDFSDAQLSAITAALGHELRERNQQDRIGIALTAFRCLNCHQRDELGGVSPERNPHFKTENPNLGPQGRIPPTLTGVGAKLNAKWMRQVLVSGRTIRPYLLTRMPQYGTENVAHLVELFQQTDKLESVEFATFNDQKEMRTTGAEMVGTGGLNCIVCHTFQLKKAANMPAVDLTAMAERLKKNWFYHYMRDPQRLSPNTIMPSFWPGGRAMRRDILNGDRDLQIEALWQYLLDGRQARTPRGLIREPLELLATDEAVMLRRSYPNIGKRGIGVGYPNQVNLAFDAEQMRLAMIWKGKFADPGGVWRSQGHGRVRPLGEDLIQFAPGPDVDDAENPWIVDEGRPPHHQFMGYSLDEKMRPRFRYEFDGVRIEDYSLDVLDPPTGRPFIRRTVVLHSNSRHSRLRFRAATGRSIERSDDHEFVVDDRLRILVSRPHVGVVEDEGELQELRIPLVLTNETVTLTVEYRW